MAPRQPSAPVARRITRSQSAYMAVGPAESTVLGKRSKSGLSRSFSLSSSSSNIGNNNHPAQEDTQASNDQAPNPKKRARRSLTALDDKSNKENIPPLRLRDDMDIDTPPASPRTQESSSSSLRRGNLDTPRRRSSVNTPLPQTPSTGALLPGVATPPTTPSVQTSFHSRVRALLRPTCDGNTIMSHEGREYEAETLKSFVHGLDDLDTASDDGILFVSGSPGTGKTALVNSVISSTTFEEDINVAVINCMSLTDADALWTKLAEELARCKSSKLPKGKEAVLAILKDGSSKCILVLDELDQIPPNSTTAKDLRVLLDYATKSPRAFRIIGIANTHTLTTTTSSPSTFSLSNLNAATIHFAPYTPQQLLSVLQARFNSLPPEELKRLLPAPSLTLLSKKVSSMTGDVRLLFEVLRNAIDLAADNPSESPDTITVTPANIIAAFKTFSAASGSSTSGAGNETVNKVKSLGIHARLVLLSLLVASKRSSNTMPTPSSSSPTKKRSPAKKYASPLATATRPKSSLGTDASQLYSLYISILAASEAFSPVSRPEFADILGLLETTGLIVMSSPSQRGLKRSASFSGMKLGSSAAQDVRLVGDMCEAEVLRGLAIEGSCGETDVMDDEIRTLWEAEMAKLRREMKTQVKDAEIRDVGFEDAMEDH